MLQSYGEIELSEDKQLIQEMMDSALSFVDNNEDVEKAQGYVLDEKSFAAALTNDVQNYDIGKEISMTTRFADVFSSKSDPGEDDDGSKEEEGKVQKVTDKKDLNRVFTAPSIDTTVGTYRSQQLMIALWSKSIKHGTGTQGV